jgi:hypothetical protein
METQLRLGMFAGKQSTHSSSGCGSAGTSAAHPPHQPVTFGVLYWTSLPKVQQYIPPAYL